MFCIKALCLADLHTVTMKEVNSIRRINKSSYDFIIVLGDNFEYLYYELSKDLLKEKKCFGVLGNHDNYGLLEKYGIENIHGNVIKENSILFGGLEGAISYKNTSFPAYSQNEAFDIMKNMKYADVIISHNGPLGYHEVDNDVHTGFEVINNYIEIYNPVCVIHGHQHINKVTVLDNGTSIIGMYGVNILDFSNGNIKNITI